MSKILANEIANYGDDSPIDLKEGLNIPAGKPVQAAGSSGTTGQVLSTTGTTVQWVTPFSGSYTDLSNRPTIPAAQVNSDWNASSGAAVILNKPVVPPQPSVTTASAGTAALAYNSGNGEFTFTPPDLSSFATETYVTTRGYLTSYTETDPVFSASAASNITTAKISNWDTSYSWGNHASVGYLTLESDTLQTVINRGNTSTSPAYFTAKLQYSNAFVAADITSSLATTYDGFFLKNSTDGNAYYSHNTAWKKLLNEDALLDNLSNVDLSVAPQNGQVLKWDSATSRWKAANDLTGGGGGGLSLTDLSVQSSTASGGGSLVYNNGSGVFTYTPPDLSSFITSIGDAIRDADFTTNGIMKRSGAGVYTSITDNSANWDTAFGWGNHASQGYLTQLPVHGLGVHTGVTLTNETAGDLLQYSGTQWVNWTPNYLTAETDTLQSVITRNGTVTSGNPAFNTSTFFTGTGTGAGNGGKPYFLWDAANNQLVGSDNIEIVLGFNGDQKIKTDGTNVLYNNFANVLHTIENSGEREAWNSKVSGVFVPSFKINHNAAVELYHANGQIRLATSSTGVTVTGALTAGGLTYPTVNGTNGQVLTSDGAGNVAWGAGGGGGASVTISDTPPAASAGDLWWESDSGRLKIYYQDVDSAQWVDVAPPLAPALSSNAPATASSTGSAGDIRYDSGYVYVCVATDTWKRAALTTW
tara:strand:- start:11106 stop:13205 length:2100 start_codon:yes stop_codon:yes gene_type:complete